MLGIASIANRMTTPMLLRGFWALMGVVHVSALISAWSSYLRGDSETSGLAGCLALSLAMVYFVLKVFGVCFIQLHATRRTWVVLSLLVVLIHADCLRPGFNNFLASGYPDLLATAAFVGGVCQIPGIRCLTRRRWGQSGSTRESTAWSILAVDRDGFLPHCWVLAAYLFRLRAPPA